MSSGSQLMTSLHSRQNQIAAGALVAAVSVMMSSNNAHRLVGRLKTFLELSKVQLSYLLDTSNCTSLGEHLSANLDVLRFLKLMYLFRIDEIDTMGDIYSTPPLHLAHMQDDSEGEERSMEAEIAVKDLVLIGGGHSHVHILFMLGMKPIKGVQVTMITRDIETPYSGMLPGHVAGFYTREECHLDLDRLAVFANVRVVQGEAVMVDRTNKQVILKGDRPPIPYDVLSINIGSAPQVSSSGVSTVPGVVPVKPIDGFGARWDQLLERADQWDFHTKEGTRPLNIIVVGGGAGGLELALSMHYRLVNEIAKRGESDKTLINMTLVSRSSTVCSSHSSRVSEIFSRVLKERGIKVLLNTEATAADGEIVCSDGKRLPFDECIWCTQGAAQGWIRKSGFDVDERGFLAVSTHLESTNTPDVFGGGDIISIVGHPRPKAGVFAVMAGMPLAINLKKRCEGIPLTDADRYIPQERFLGLLGLGDGNCIASRGSMALEGKYLWELKDWIDRKWMYVYKQGLPDMEDMMPSPPQPSLAALSAGKDVLAVLESAPMRCGGCGAKVGATALSNAMKTVNPRVVRRPEVIMGVDSPDDCAVVSVGSNNNGTQTFNIHSVDFFRSFYEDPYVFGQIAANHALSDCHAMCAPAVSALAIVVVPFGLEKKVTQVIVQMMAGACEALKESNCALVGGHTCEGKEMALGFVINGVAQGEGSSMPSNCLTKGGMNPGDVLVLTKAIGTGVLFAARMRNKSRGRWISHALASMTQSSRVAAELALEHGATACTDVTGFGLLGHLVEMCQASSCGASLSMDTIPVLDGAVECTKNRIFSSLQPQNLRLRHSVVPGGEAHEVFPLLFDPQTSGGLLVSMPADAAEKYVSALHDHGYCRAAVIGGVVNMTEGHQYVTLS